MRWIASGWCTTELQSLRACSSVLPSVDGSPGSLRLKYDCRCYVHSLEPVACQYRWEKQPRRGITRADDCMGMGYLDQTHEIGIALTRHAQNLHEYYNNFTMIWKILHDQTKFSLYRRGNDNSNMDHSSQNITDNHIALQRKDWKIHDDGLCDNFF